MSGNSMENTDAQLVITNFINAVDMWSLNNQYHVNGDDHDDNYI